MSQSSIRLIAFALAIPSGVVAAPAAAQTAGGWSMAGAACVPTGQTAAGVGTFNSAGDVGFAASRTGEVIVTCPVSSTIARALILGVTYRDPDGSGNDVRISAALRQKNLDTGGISTVFNANFDSNSHPPVNGYARRSIELAHGLCQGGGFTFDHARNAYYVQVNIRRSSATAQALLASVDLNIIPTC